MHPLVNILRGAMSILVAVVSHPHTSATRTSQPHAFGFRALKPAIAAYPQFLEMLVSRLSSADHALCTNALQLINSLMRDAVTNGAENEWPKFIKRLQDLGVIRAVYGLMQGTALQDLAHPLLEFQALTKVLLRKWRDVSFDLDKPEHRRAFKCVYLAGSPERVPEPSNDGEDSDKKKHNPENWRRLGFESESPAWEFEEVGFLGMMDLGDFVRRTEDGFQKLLLEQSTQPQERRCPIARASLSVTAILYEHFEIDKSDLEESKGYLALDSRQSIDRIFKPMILQWSKLHASGLQAFLRLWKSTGAEVGDFPKVAELVRILLEAVVGGASRTKEIQEVEEELASFEYQRLRELQMELLELTYEDTWGHHLRQVRDQLDQEALQFIKEQRIRCLLQGAWFPNAVTYKPDTGPVTKGDIVRAIPPPTYRYVRLSHNRRWLHYAEFPEKGTGEPSLEELPEKSKSSVNPHSHHYYLSTLTAPQSISAPSPRSSPTSPPPQTAPPRPQPSPRNPPPPPPASPSTATSPPPPPPPTTPPPTPTPTPTATPNPPRTRTTGRKPPSSPCTRRPTPSRPSGWTDSSCC